MRGQIGLVSILKVTRFWGAAIGISAASLFCSDARAVFIPPNSANLTVWLDAGVGVSVDGSGNVSSWADQSVNGNNAVQATTASRPFFVASSATFNNMPVVSFDGSDDFMQAPLPLTATGGFTTFIVAQSRGGGNNSVILDGFDTDFFNSGQWFQEGNFGAAGGTSGYVNRGSGMQYNTDTGTVDTNKHIFMLMWSGTTNILTQSVDNTLTSVGAGSFTDISLTTLEIAAQFAGVSVVAPGDLEVAEVLVYGTALSAGDTATVESYLNDKYFVVSAPEPTGIAVLGLASLPLLRRRSRAVGA